MSTFEEREAAFENKYAYDADVQFKVNARSNKMLGLWAAEKLGKTGAEAEAYAKEVVISDLEEAGHEDVVRKVAADLGDKSDTDEIWAKMDEFLTEAKKQIMTED